MERDYVTVVSGLPRSGTSVMMQMLVAGGLAPLSDGARTADEDNPRGYLELEAVKRTRQDPSWLAAAAGKVVKVIHLLLRDLPADRQYRVIFLRRSVAEVVASQRAMLARSGRQGANLPDDKLAAVFEAQVRETEGWLARQPNFRLLAVEHRDLIQRPAEMARAVNEFLGGGLDEAAMAAVVDPALYRQRAR
jgi:hypothetical protein